MQIDIIKFPRTIIISYLIFTFILYLISPWDWPKANLGFLILFNVFIWISIYFGFEKGLNSSWKIRKKIMGPLCNKSYWNILLFISIIYIYPNFLVRLQMDSISFGEIFYRFKLSLFSFADTYFLKEESLLERSSIFENGWMFFYTIMGPLVYFTKYLALYYWKRLTNLQKILLIIVFVSDLLAFFSIGTNKGIFDIVLNIPFLVIVILNKQKNIFAFTISPKFTKTIILAFILGIYFFGLTFQSRINNQTLLKNPITKGTINYNVFYMKMLPEKLINGYLGLDFYLTHGYNGLDKAFDYKYEPTFGQGSSPMLNTLLAKVGVYDYSNGKTYEDKISNDYMVPKGLFWYTAFVAFANDVSFIGVPLVIYLLAFYFSKAWKDLIINKNVGALPIVTLFVIVFFYLNANNQILGKSQLINFITLFLFWGYFRIIDINDVEFFN